MTLRWYGGEPYNPPTQIECSLVGYPNTDARGRVQYENTHFDDEIEAWENVRRNVEAGVSLNRRDVEQAAAVLAKAKARLVKSIEELETFDAAYRERYGGPVAPTSEGPKE